MKKIFSFMIAVAFAVVTSAGCNAILDTITNSPIFFVPEKMYDGQEFQITRLSTCKYEWSVSSPCFTIRKTTIGSDSNIAVGKADLSSVGKDAVMVTVTATNPDKADEKPVEHEILVMSWSLKVYDMTGKEVAANALKVNTKYEIRTVGSRNYMSGGLMKDKSGYHNLEWSATIGKLSAPDLKEGEVDRTMAKTFICTEAGTARISAKLCEKTNYVDVTIK